jgi:hypothetical protein
VEEWCLVVSLVSPECRQSVAVSMAVRRFIEILSFSSLSVVVVGCQGRVQHIIYFFGILLCYLELTRFSDKFSPSESALDIICRRLQGWLH